MRKLVCKTHSQSGQVLLVLLLIMTVALAIGLSVVQRSVTDVSTSTKVEESARAFSAAEAGIERAINKQGAGSLDVNTSELNNASSALVGSYALPDVTIPIYESPPVRQDKPGSLWLVNPANLPSLTNAYTGSSLEVLWGVPPALGAPAIELTIVYADSGTYKVQKSYYDPQSSRAAVNKFSSPTQCVASNVVTNVKRSAPGKDFATCTSISIPANAILLRTRLIYTADQQQVAFRPVGGSLLPVQEKLFISTGTSGETKRTVELHNTGYQLPFFFDFVLFSLSNITK